MDMALNAARCIRGVRVEIEVGVEVGRWLALRPESKGYSLLMNRPDSSLNKLEPAKLLLFYCRRLLWFIS